MEIALDEWHFMAFHLLASYMEVPHYRLSNALIFDFGAQAAELARRQCKLEDLLFFKFPIAGVLFNGMDVSCYFAICCC